MKKIFLFILFIVFTIGCLNTGTSNGSIRIVFEEGTTDQEANRLMSNYSITNYNKHNIKMQNETGTYDVIVFSFDAKILSNKEEFVNKMNKETIVAHCSIEYPDG